LVEVEIPYILDKRMFAASSHRITLLVGFALLTCIEHSSALHHSESTLDPKLGAVKRRKGLGIDLTGRVKCLVRGPESKDAPAKPLFACKRDQQPFVYATAEYAFQKERWYGIERWGTMLRWQPTKYGNYAPCNVDLVAERQLESDSLLDSSSVRLEWDISERRKPKVELRLDRPKGAAHVGLFVPLYNRLHLYCISHLSWKETGDSSSFSSYAKMLSKDKPKENSDWWVPELKLDPFGLITSDNQCSSLYNGRYLMRLRLRFSKRVPFLCTWDEEDEMRLRLECSVVDKKSLDSVSTARLEALVEPSSLKQALSSTRLVLIHEHDLSKSFTNSGELVP
jgi:hypothetical protein